MLTPAAPASASQLVGCQLRVVVPSDSSRPARQRVAGSLGPRGRLLLAAATQEHQRYHAEAAHQDGTAIACIDTGDN
jgi:hypothetical protein